MADEPQTLEERVREIVARRADDIHSGMELWEVASKVDDHINEMPQVELLRLISEAMERNPTCT